MQRFIKHAHTVSVSQNHWAVQCEEQNRAAQYLGTTDPSAGGTDSILSVWKVPILSTQVKMVSSAPNTEFAIQEKSSTALMGMWEIILKPYEVLQSVYKMWMSHWLLQCLNLHRFPWVYENMYLPVFVKNTSSFQIATAYQWTANKKKTGGWILWVI